MKKLVSLLLVLVMMMGLSVTAFADDGTQSTTVTVTIATGTYTVSIPENVVLNAKKSDSYDETTDEFQYRLGDASVHSVEGCTEVYCDIAATPLKNSSSDVLKSRFELNTLLDKEENITDYSSSFVDPAYWFTLPARSYPYYEGRVSLQPNPFAGIGGDKYNKYDYEYDYINLVLYIKKADIEAAVPGEYVSTLTFTFGSL